MRNKNTRTVKKISVFFGLAEGMEAALLEGEDVRNRNNNSSRSDRKAFTRRSDAIAYGSTYQRAAALVDLVCF